MVRWLAFNLMLLGCCGYALRRGGAPERLGSLIFLVAAALTVLGASPFGTRFHHVELGILVVDAAILFAFVALAIRSERFWPIWMAGLQTVEVLTHFARLVTPDIIPPTYGEAIALWSYPMLVLLAIGTWRHRRRLRRFGADNPWKNASG
jgi:hypothetical protein